MLSFLFIIIFYSNMKKLLTINLLFILLHQMPAQAQKKYSLGCRDIEQWADGPNEPNLYLWHGPNASAPKYCYQDNAGKTNDKHHLNIPSRSDRSSILILEKSAFANDVARYTLFFRQSYFLDCCSQQA